jgi:hypothetical protein
LMLKAARCVGRGDPHNMSVAEVEQLVQASGLRILRSVPLGYLNWTDTWMLRPRSLALSTERMLTNARFLPQLAQNFIYVCSR